MTDARAERTSEEAAAADRRASSRRVLAALFWLLASLSVLVGGVTLWAHQTLLTSDGWGNLVGEVVSDPEVVEDISSTVVTRVSDSLGVRQVPSEHRSLVGRLLPQGKRMGTNVL